MFQVKINRRRQSRFCGLTDFALPLRVTIVKSLIAQNGVGKHFYFRSAESSIQLGI